MYMYVCVNVQVCVFACVHVHVHVYVNNPVFLHACEYYSVCASYMCVPMLC